MTENMNNGGSQRDSAEHEGYSVMEQREFMEKARFLMMAGGISTE